MSDEKQEAAAKEQKLVKLYCELTGASEASGRSVYMLVESPDAKKEEAPEKLSEPPKPGS